MIPETLCDKMIKTNKSETEIRSENPSTIRQWMTAILVNSTLVTYGLQIGWVSPMTKILQSDASPLETPLSDNEISLLAAVICLVAVAAIPLYAYISDSCGRIRGILAIAVPQAICWVITLLATNSATLVTARALCGVAAAGCFNVIPIYVKEISQDSVRGYLGTLMVVFQNVGMLGIFAMGAYFDYYTILWIVICIPIATFPFLMRAPESPAFLVKIGKIEEAASVVAYLRGLNVDHHVVQKEIEGIKTADLYFKSIPDMSYRAIFKVNSWRRGFILCFLMMSVHALNGCTVISNYAVSLLSASGVIVSPELQSLSFPVVMIMASLVTMSIIEKTGRKPILICSLALAALALSTIGTVVLLQQKGYFVPAWVTVCAMIAAVAAYAGGVSPVPYVIMSEMFHFQIRAKFLGLLVAHAWMLSFVQLIVFGPITRAFGQHTAYYLHATVNILGVFVALVLPETKGKSIDQIEDELSKKK